MVSRQMTSGEFYYHKYVSLDPVGTVFTYLFKVPRENIANESISRANVIRSLRKLIPVGCEQFLQNSDISFIRSVSCVFCNIFQNHR